MSDFRIALEHLKNDVMYPTDRKGVVTACNNMSDLSKADADWFSKTLPEGKYKNAEDVLRAVLTKL